MQWISDNEMLVRLGCFLGVMLLMMLWEIARPARKLRIAKHQRWLGNLSLVALDTLLLRLLFPAAAVGVAVFAQSRGWGLLPLLDAPLWLEVLLAVVLLDLAIYLQHVMVHAVPLLWRLHRVHHADLDFDLSTALRFHPLEIILSMLIKFSLIVLLGPPVVAVLIFEVLLNGMAMFNHGNVHLPRRLEGPLRALLVTPDMHRVHHSREADETNSNFGFNLSIWDRLFGTYKSQAKAGQDGMQIGLHGEDDPRRVVRLDGLLLMPFRLGGDHYAINRRSWNKPDE